jgi:hypothetical protein
MPDEWDAISPPAQQAQGAAAAATTDEWDEISPPPPVGGASGSWTPPSTLENIEGGISRGYHGMVAQLESGGGEIAHIAGAGLSAIRADRSSALAGKLEGKLKAESLEERQEATQAVGDPNSVAGQISQTGTQILGSIPLAASGIPGMIAFGTMAMGAGAQEADATNASPERRYVNDILQGGLGMALGAAPRIFPASGLLGGMAESAGKMGGYQAASNLATKATVNPQQSIGQGVGTMAAIGAGGEALAHGVDEWSKIAPPKEKQTTGEQPANNRQTTGEQGEVKPPEAAAESSQVPPSGDKSQQLPPTAAESAPVKQPDEWDQIAPPQKALPAESTTPFMGRQAGQIVLPESVHQFGEQDVRPAVAASVSGAARAIEGVKNLFGMQSGDPALQTRQLFREAGGTRARRMDQFNDAMQGAERQIDKLPKDEQLAITDNAEHRIPQNSPDLQKVSDYLRSQFDDRLEQIQAIDPEFHGLENYMAHVYEGDPATNAKILRELYARRPMAGSGGFTKARVFETQADALAAGLKPVSNPITAARLRLGQMDRWITAHNVFNELEAQGITHDLPRGQRPMEGYKRLPDPLFGEKQAPEPVANVFENALTPGLTSHAYFGPLTRGYLMANNLLNQANLGISAFHAGTSAINSSASELALAMEDAYGGQGKLAARRLATAAVPGLASVRDYFTGGSVADAWLHPENASPEMKLIADAMQIQGARMGMDKFYHTGMTDKMLKAWNNGNPIGAGVRLPFAALEQFAKPIMEKLVPRLKMGAFAEMARSVLAKDPSITNAQDLSDAMGSAWRSVDNRFGQVVHDNDFWNRTLKDLSFATLRSVGWNKGNVEEFGGGAADALAGAKDAVTGNAPGLTHRLAYTVALPTLVGLYGAVYHYLHTGQPPQSMQDLYAPKNGQKNADGTDTRVFLPSAMKDYLAIKDVGLSQVVKNKLAPMLETITGLAENKDYFNREIANPDDNPAWRILERAGFVAKQAEPYSIEQFRHGVGPAAFLGITKAPRFEQQSAAQQLAYQLGYHGNGEPIDAVEAQRIDDARAVREEAGKNGFDAGNAMAEQLRAKGHEISDESSRQWVMQGLQYEKQGPLIYSAEHLSVPDVLKVYKVATLPEREALFDMLTQGNGGGKIGRSRSMTQAQKDAAMAELQAMNQPQ